MTKITLPSLLMVLSLSATAQTTVPLVTFGNQAEAYQGDDDFTHTLFVKIPAENAPQRLFLRIFDPDCGGAQDES